MSVNLWWAFNDGMTGHVWLGEREVDALRREMVLQGMAEAFPVEKLAPKAGEHRAQVTPQQIEAALEVASGRRPRWETRSSGATGSGSWTARATRAASDPLTAAQRASVFDASDSPQVDPGLPVPPRRAYLGYPRVVRGTVPKLETATCSSRGLASRVLVPPDRSGIDPPLLGERQDEEVEREDPENGTLPALSLRQELGRAAELAERADGVTRSARRAALTLEHDGAHAFVDRGEVSVEELLGVVRLGRDERPLAELQRRLLGRRPVAARSNDEPPLVVGRLERGPLGEESATSADTPLRSSPASAAHPTSAAV